jgi:transposase-like protein
MKSNRRRLSKEQWKEIEELLKDPERNLTKIANSYGINRKSVYIYAWHKGWLVKEQTLWNKIKSHFKSQ